MHIPGYKIESKVGQGGMAMVYRAVQESLQRVVALKVLNPLFADSHEFTQRFLNEGRMLASLVHPNIITIYDLGASQHVHFIAMEFIESADLKTVMRERLPIETSIGYVRSIGAALSYAHSKGIVHRDIKPSNVLFREDGTVLLSDFGIAKQAGSRSDLTGTGSTMGSPYYLSPEQARGQSVDARADLYSLGIMLYELLTGSRPFSGDSEFDTMMRHVTSDIPALPTELTAFESVIAMMTAKSPEQRFGDVTTAVAALDAAAARWRSGELPGTPEASIARPAGAELPAVPPSGARADTSQQPATSSSSEAATGTSGPASAGDPVVDDVAALLALDLGQPEILQSAMRMVSNIGSESAPRLMNEALAVQAELKVLAWRVAEDGLVYGALARLKTSDYSGHTEPMPVALENAQHQVQADNQQLARHQEQLRKLGANVNKAIAYGDALSQQFARATAATKPSLLLRGQRDLLLALGRRTRELESSSAMVEQGLLATEFVVRINRELDRGIALVLDQLGAGQQHDEQLHAVLEYCRRVRQPTDGVLAEFAESVTRVQGL